MMTKAEKAEVDALRRQLRVVAESLHIRAGHGPGFFATCGNAFCQENMRLCFPVKKRKPSAQKAK